jgi:hypothetical protein
LAIKSIILHVNKEANLSKMQRKMKTIRAKEENGILKIGHVMANCISQFSQARWISAYSRCESERAAEATQSHGHELFHRCLLLTGFGR